jgi:hypothetical protein
MLYDQLVNLYTESEDSVLLENVQFIRAVKQWRTSQGKPPGVRLTGDEAKEFLRSVGDTNPTSTLRQIDCDTQTCDMGRTLSSSQLNTLAYILTVNDHLPEPEPVVGPQGPADPAGGSPVTVNVHGGGTSSSSPTSTITPPPSATPGEPDESDHWQTGAAIGGALGAGIAGITNLKPGGAGSEWITTPAIGAALGAATASAKHKYKKLKNKHPTLARIFAGSSLFAAGAVLPKGYRTLRKLQGSNNTEDQ